jgi:ABC-type multidrug transport system permease subunit
VKDSLIVYTLSDDERKELLAGEIKLVIGQIKTAAAQAGGNADGVLSTLTKMNEALPSKEVQVFASADSVNLSNEQREQKGLMGYAFAILTLGYVFVGIFVAHTVIKERKDMVTTRIRLTNLSDTGYFAGKLIVGVIVSAVLTVIMAGCSFFISSDKLAMSRIGFIAMIFLLGLIFSTISLVVGVLLGNVMSANIAAFALWSMSSMLAGLYFPLDSTSDAIKTLSYIMPQKWFMRGTELSMANDNSAFLIVLGVTAAYLIVTLSLGSVGIKLKKNE